MIKSVDALLTSETLIISELAVSDKGFIRVFQVIDFFCGTKQMGINYVSSLLLPFFFFFCKIKGLF